MRYSFHKKERLCSRKLIEKLFSSGEAVLVYPFRVLYLLLPTTDDIQLQVLFSVPKKRFKRAVKRNLIRRRAKEAFRLNKHLLYEHIPKDHKLLMAFIYIDENIQLYDVIKKGIIRGFEKINVSNAKTNSNRITNSVGRKK